METTNNPEIAIHDLIRNRRSHRAFAAKPVDRDKLVRLLEAARWTPSARNDQPWRFVVVPNTNTVHFEGILEGFQRFNSCWAKNAAVFIVAIGRTAWEAGGETNPFSAYDLGQAVAYLTLQAEAEGLVSRQIGAFNSDPIRKVLEVPNGYSLLTVVAMGYPGEVDSLPAEYRSLETAPRTRKALGEIAFDGKWGKPLVP
jgi:nitroreductase